MKMPEIPPLSKQFMNDTRNSGDAERDYISQMENAEDILKDYSNWLYNLGYLTQYPNENQE